MNKKALVVSCAATLTYGTFLAGIIWVPWRVMKWMIVVGLVVVGLIVVAYGSYQAVAIGHDE